MALRFPRFSQGLAQDPTTRRIWFGIATAHDFESHDDITEEPWQGNFETWVQDPLHVRPIAHAIWDPHFGQPAVEAFTHGGALGPVNIAYSGVYQWWTIRSQFLGLDKTFSSYSSSHLFGTPQGAGTAILTLGDSIHKRKAYG
ncbi:hypothetical protein HN51_066137 [Arachis hypogaea]